MKTIHKDRIKVREIPGSSGWVDMNVSLHNGPVILFELSPQERVRLAAILLEVPLGGTKDEQAMET